MAALWIILISVSTFLITISLVVIGQEFHPAISLALAAVLIYGAVRLFKARVTRI